MWRANCDTPKNALALTMLCAVRGRVFLEGLFLFSSFFSADLCFSFLPRGGAVSHVRLHDACKQPMYLLEPRARAVGTLWFLAWYVWAVLNRYAFLEFIQDC